MCPLHLLQTAMLAVCLNKPTPPPKLLVLHRHPLWLYLRLKNVETVPYASPSKPQNSRTRMKREPRRNLVLLRPLEAGQRVLGLRLCSRRCLHPRTRPQWHLSLSEFLEVAADLRLALPVSQALLPLPRRARRSPLRTDCFFRLQWRKERPKRCCLRLRLLPLLISSH